MNPSQSWVFGVAMQLAIQSAIQLFVSVGLSVVESVFSDTFLRFNNVFFFFLRISFS